MSSKPIVPGEYGPEARIYLLDNLFPLTFFIVSLVMGILIEIYSLSMHHSIAALKGVAKSGVMLGIFIVVSGLWVFTDSKVLSVFTVEYGGRIHQNAVLFISYISLMLLPIVFISFLWNIMPISKKLWIIDSLFILNLCAFVLASSLGMPREYALLFLVIHHTLIYILMILGTVYCIRNLRGTKNPEEKWLSLGLIFFLLFGGAALILFLLGFSDLYVIMYCAGFIVMIQYMIKLTVHQMLSTYNQSVKAELYKSMAYTDVLTNIKNRNAFIQEQYNNPVSESTCYIVMDINRLKWVNDTMGHNYGDRLIHHSANVIFHSFCDLGDCYRMGGDEFAVVCRNTNEGAIQDAIANMYHLISEENVDSDVEISLSCGYAFGGNDLTNFTDLLNIADQRMYQDKKSKGAVRQ